jgi:hypothetical protein
MPATIDLTQAEVVKQVGKFLKTVLGADVEIVRAQENRTPMPRGGFIAVTPGAIRRLGTNTHTYTDPGTNPGTLAIRGTHELSLQLDFYGKAAQAQAVTVATVFRDEYAVSQFPDGIAPLHANDATQLPLITGEEEFLERWKLELKFGFTPTVTVPQDFADKLEIGNAGNPVTKDTPINPGLPSEPWNGLKPLL